MQSLLPAFVMLLCLAMAPASLLTAPTPDRGPWLVMAPPWAEIDVLLSGAGARPIGPVSAPFGTLADGPPGAGARIAAAGAWAVLDARRIAAICGVDLDAPEDIGL